MDYKKTFYNKKILVIGGTGTIGRKIIELILGYSPSVIRVFSRDEHKQFIMRNELGDLSNIRFLIGDVRDYERVLRASRDVDIIFHLAAMKHVPASEYDPFEAVKTNVIGTQNVITAAIENNVEKVVFTSSDKAISPTNAMGATKLLAERLITSANNIKGFRRTIFSSVRFGNVLGSRGSVLELFKKQIIENSKVTITNREMSRFMMSISDAAKLTLEAVAASKCGEVFVLKMPVIRLGDLIDVFIEETCKKINLPVSDVIIDEIGLRPGEKMYEELMTKEESAYAYELNNMYAILPVFSEIDNKPLYNKYKKAKVQTYSSNDSLPIGKEEVRKLILDEKII